MIINKRQGIKLTFKTEAQAKKVKRLIDEIFTAKVIEFKKELKK